MSELADKLAVSEAAQSSGKGVTLYDRMNDQLPEIKRALPVHMDSDRFVRVALTQVRKNKMLASCEATSLLGAVMQLAQVGLEADGRNAHLVPFPNNRRGVVECQAIIDYRGFMELARRSGQVADIYASAVYEGDEFSYRYGLHRDIVHVPTDGDRGEITHAYAVVNFTSGGFAFEVLTAEDINNRKAHSKTSDKKTSMWQTAPAAAAKKSAVRALSPYLPYSPELARAEHMDNKTEFGIDDGGLLDLEGEEVSVPTEPEYAPGEEPFTEGGE